MIWLRRLQFLCEMMISVGIVPFTALHVCGIWQMNICQKPVCEGFDIILPVIYHTVYLPSCFGNRVPHDLTLLGF